VNDENPFEGKRTCTPNLYYSPKKNLRSDAKAHDFNYFFVFFIGDEVRWVSFERTILLHNNSNTSQQKEKE
jgi:hypothetical protein